MEQAVMDGVTKAKCQALIKHTIQPDNTTAMCGIITGEMSSRFGGEVWHCRGVSCPGENQYCLDSIVSNENDVTYLNFRWDDWHFIVWKAPNSFIKVDELPSNHAQKVTEQPSISPQKVTESPTRSPQQVTEAPPMIVIEVSHPNGALSHLKPSFHLALVIIMALFHGNNLMMRS